MSAKERVETLKQICRDNNLDYEQLKQGTILVLDVLRKRGHEHSDGMVPMIVVNGSEIQHAMVHQDVVMQVYMQSDFAIKVSEVMDSFTH